jgi:CRISPR-associated endonuclease/helicase Cas3
MSTVPLYPYQERVKQLINSGKSVILQAPTGLGKTRAALAPFIEAFFDKTPDLFPTKCIYSVPMRVLANQFVSEYQDCAESYARRYHRNLNVSIQTGEQSNDRRFDSDLVFCTIDQFLSSYLVMPYSLPLRLANLNSGAITGSYLVFDEFHLLDPGSTLPTTLHAIQVLSKVAPVLLMTATFSTTVLASLANLLKAAVVTVSPQEVHQIESRDGQYPRLRRWSTAAAPLAADHILDLHRSRSLALCNTVQRAQQLYHDLLQAIQSRGLECRVLLLHSRFLPGDRRNIEVSLRNLFGKNDSKGDQVVAVATQAIEVGVDITCETLHTELAPASALIQRAGRCARYPGEQGEVIVYPVDSYAPYGKEREDSGEEGDWVKEMKAAFTWIRNNSGEVFDFAKEQALIDAVATPRDRKILDNLSYGRVDRQQDIYRVMSGYRQIEDQRLLIRDADSRLVLIHSSPETLLKSPYSATGFNLPLSTLFGLYKRWEERAEELDLDWSVKRLIEDQGEAGENLEGRQIEYDWRLITDASLLPGSRVLVVNPALTGYSKEEGFLPDKADSGFESTIPPDAEEQTWEGFSYVSEAYEDHIQYVMAAFQEHALPEAQRPFLELAGAANWYPESLEWAAWLVCLFHDVGKLRNGWQSWARSYQKEINRPVDSRFALAHTDHQPHNPLHQVADRKVARKYPKPHHACEGALAVSSLLVQALPEEDLVRASLSAIARHHTPFAQECQTYHLEPQALDHISSTLDLLPVEIRKRIDLNQLRMEVNISAKSFSNLIILPQQTYGWLAYTLLVRSLRVADQKGTAEGSRIHESSIQ